MEENESTTSAALSASCAALLGKLLNTGSSEMFGRSLAPGCPTLLAELVALPLVERKKALMARLPRRRLVERKRTPIPYAQAEKL